MQSKSDHGYDILAIGAHPDDLEVVMGGTAIRLARKGLRVLFVDLCDGEPARHAARGERHLQAVKAAEILGVKRTALMLQDRSIGDTVEARIQVARLLREYRPRMVFTTAGSGVHPDHKAVTDIVANAVFYARLPKWDEIPGGEQLKDTTPHEIERLFFGHCRMEAAWDRFDFAVDVSDVYDKRWPRFALMSPCSAETRPHCSTNTTPRTVTSAALSVFAMPRLSKRAAPCW